jgi:hypothetical protein
MSEKTMYRVFYRYGEISLRAIKVIKMTPVTVTFIQTLAGGREFEKREHIATAGCNWFDTFEKAKLWAVDVAHQKVDAAVKELNRASLELDRLNNQEDV